MLSSDLLPPPRVIRERLARCQREAALLRSLLRLADRAVAERTEHRDIFGIDPSTGTPKSHPEADGQVVAR